MDGPQTEQEEGANGADDAERAALDAASAGSDLSAQTAHDATEYFLGKKGRPGEGKTYSIDVDFGTPGEHDVQRCTFRYLDPDTFEDCETRAELKDERGGIDAYVRASWVFARAIIQPAMGPLLNTRNSNPAEDGLTFPDAAALVRHTFELQPGVLFRAEGIIRRRSRMSDLPDEYAAKEVEAGKTSS